MVRVHSITAGLTEDETTTAIGGLFEAINTSDSGGLSEGEVKQALELLGIWLDHDDDLTELFKEADHNSSGALELDEWVAVMRNATHRIGLVKLFDKGFCESHSNGFVPLPWPMATRTIMCVRTGLTNEDYDGAVLKLWKRFGGQGSDPADTIDCATFEKILRQMQLIDPTEEVSPLFDEMDWDGDGLVTFEEWHDMWNSLPSKSMAFVELYNEAVVQLQVTEPAAVKTLSWTDHSSPSLTSGLTQDVVAECASELYRFLDKEDEGLSLSFVHDLLVERLSFDSLTAEETEEWFNEADVNKSGLIELDDFVEMFANKPVFPRFRLAIEHVLLMARANHCANPLDMPWNDEAPRSVPALSSGLSGEQLADACSSLARTLDVTGYKGITSGSTIGAFLDMYNLTYRPSECVKIVGEVTNFRKEQFRGSDLVEIFRGPCNHTVLRKIVENDVLGSLHEGTDPQIAWAGRKGMSMIFAMSPNHIRSCCKTMFLCLSKAAAVDDVVTGDFGQDQIKFILQKLGYQCQDEEVHHILHEADFNKSGLLEFDDFLDMFTTKVVFCRLRKYLEHTILTSFAEGTVPGLRLIFSPQVTKSVLSLATKSTVPELAPHLASLFRQCKSPDNEAITPDDVKDLLKRFDIDITLREAKHIIESSDRKSVGSIDEKTFCEPFHSVLPKPLFHKIIEDQILMHQARDVPSPLVWDKKPVVSLTAGLRKDVVRDAVHRLFVDLDKNRSGYIESEDLEKVLTAIGLPFFRHQAAFLIWELDESNTGRLSEEGLFAGFVDRRQKTHLILYIEHVLMNSMMRDTLAPLPWNPVPRTHVLTLTTGMSDEELQTQCRSLFDTLDTDGQGHIGRSDLRNVLQDLDLDMTESELKAVIDEVDLDSSGTIEFNELLDMFRVRNSQRPLLGKMLEQGILGYMAEGKAPRLPWILKHVSKTPGVTLSTEELRQICRIMFNDLDIDNSGTIDKDELRAMMKRLKIEMTSAQLHQAFEEVDTNRSGTIEFEEFLSTLTEKQTKSQLRLAIEHSIISSSAAGEKFPLKWKAAPVQGSRRRSRVFESGKLQRHDSFRSESSTKVSSMTQNMLGQVLCNTGRNYIVFVFGKTNSGKTTHCDLIAKKFSYIHLDIYESDPERDVKNVISDIRKLLSTGKKKLLLDGFPRNLSDAMTFEKEISAPDFALFLDAPEACLQHRKGRLNFHHLVTKFERDTKKVVERYKNMNKLWKVDADMSIGNVHRRIYKLFDEEYTSKDLQEWATMYDLKVKDTTRMDHLLARARQANGYNAIITAILEDLVRERPTRPMHFLNESLKHLELDSVPGRNNEEVLLCKQSVINLRKVLSDLAFGGPTEDPVGSMLRKLRNAPIIDAKN